jgi:hypothetical protein
MERTAHSSEVRIQLAVNGHVFSVAQLGPDFLVLRDPIDHAPDQAQITMSIDDDVKQWAVQLVDGILASRLKTPIVDCVLSST